MKKVVDTNFFVTACISNSYKNKILNYLKDNDSLTVLTISNEIRHKLLIISTALTFFMKISIKGDLTKFPVLNELKANVREVYDYLVSLKEADRYLIIQNILRDAGKFLAFLNNINYYPPKDNEVLVIVEKHSPIFNVKLNGLKSRDINHLYLMYDYTQKFASEIKFYTDDKGDYLNNKKLIESLFTDIKLMGFSDY
ncbi:MAG: hypothetical protein PHD81_02050 [Candidatus Nanoarchaeia archaeon]|nr:hypothetical protein [Candidatus Nanoarchaeia archaeon]MDD5587872.1 hypothetical protein [Candidatus Nanoarchaeia archaeon]